MRFSRHYLIKATITPVAGVACLLLAASCSPSDTEMAALDQAEAAMAREDSVENAMVETLDEINRNLEMIRERQGIISMRSPEDLSVKDDILDNIRIINSLIEDNRKRNDELTMQVKKLRRDKNAFVKVADQMRERMQRQEEEIAVLKDMLREESFRVDELNRKVSELETEKAALLSEKDLLEAGNATLDRDLNKGWFTYGTSKQLLEKGLVEKKGGFLGLGRKESLTAAFHRNKGIFTEIDIRETTLVPLHGKKPKLLTPHPAGSYELRPHGTSGEYSELVINDPDEFYTLSRFVIVEVQ